MDVREERIVVETARYRLTGTVQLPREGFRSRLTDHLNAAEREFVALTDVEIEPLDRPAAGEPPPPRHEPFVAISRRHIVFAVAADGGGEGARSGG